MRVWRRTRLVAGVVVGALLGVAVGAVPLPLAHGAPGRGGPLHAQPAPLPAPVGYVNDFANVIAPDARQRLEALAERVRAATGGDVVVVTLPSLQGRPVEEVALRLGREWKVGGQGAIGEQARNAGVVILVVPKETADDGRGRCRIEVGQGAEGFITDATAGTLCREQVPLFQAREYGAAVEGLAEAVAGLYASAFGVSLEGARAPQPSGPPGRRGGDGGFPWVLAIVLVLFVLSSLGGRRRSGCVGCLPIPIPGPPMHRGGWHVGGGGFGGFGGGGGGGFGGFGGGGGFSGGGGGSDW